MKTSTAPGSPVIAVAQSLSDLIVLDRIVTGDLHVDGRRQAEIQNLTRDISGLEKKVSAGKSGGQAYSKLAGILRRRAMPGV